MTAHYDNPNITCYECSKGWHAEPHRAVCNGGSTIMLWGSTGNAGVVGAAIKLMALQLCFSKGHPGSIHDDEANGRTTLFLWLAHPQARALAEEIWPRCNDIAVQFHRDLLQGRPN